MSLGIDWDSDSTIGSSAISGSEIGSGLGAWRETTVDAKQRAWC